jgi:hypothetical protein
MDILTFIAELIRALAWPLSVLAIFIVLRKQIVDRIPLLNRLKYKDFEIEFGKEVAEAKDIIHKESSKTLPEKIAPSSYDYYETLAEASPRGAILEAWISFESSAMSSLQALKLTLQRGPIPFPELLRKMKEAELISKEEETSLSKLRKLRNTAVHESGVPIRKSDVIEFIHVMRDLTDQVASRAWNRMPKNC